jgi:peptidyl-prolyl cis-trans isomerase B (cyclophilin B)
MGQKKYKQKRMTEKELQKIRLERSKERKKIILIALAAVVVIGIAVGSAFTIKHINSEASKATSSDTSEPNYDGKVPDKAIAENKKWTGTITTSRGNIGVELYGDKAPQAVAVFIQLSKDDYWSKKNATCPRITTSEKFALLQCGAPGGDQAGGPGFEFGPVENAPKDNKYPKGSLAMARQGDNGDSMGSQFFIVYKDTDIPADSAGGYTLFGKVTSGLNVVSKIGEDGTEDGSTDGKPKDEVRIEKVDIK